MAHVAMRARGIGALVDCVEQPRSVARLDDIVMEIEKEEIGVCPIQQEVDIPRPTESLRLRENQDAGIGLRVRSADFYRPVLRSVDRYQYARVLVGLPARAEESPVDKRLGLPGGD
jgi:hypothetical protein